MGALNFADAFTLELPEGWVARERLPRTRLPGAILETGSDAYLTLELLPGSEASGDLPVEAVLVALTDDEENQLHLELELPPPSHPSGLPFAWGSRPGRKPELRVHLGLLHAPQAGLQAMLVCDVGEADLVQRVRTLLESARLRRSRPWWRFW